MMSTIIGVARVALAASLALAGAPASPPTEASTPAEADVRTSESTEAPTSESTAETEQVGPTQARAAEVPLAVEPVAERVTVVPEPPPAPTPEPVGIAPEPEEDDDDAFADEPGDDGDGELDAYNPLVDSPEALRSRHWVRAGSVLIAVGAVLGIGGLAMAAVADPCIRAAGNGCQADAQRRAALTLGVPGAVFLVGGAASLGVGLTQKKRLRASVQMSRRGAMVGLSGQF